MKNARNSATKQNRNGSPKLNKPSLPPDSSSASIKLRPAERRQIQALRSLGVTLEQVERSPAVTAILRENIGAVSKAIAAMRFSPEPCILKFLAVYDQATMRDNLPLEAVCIAAEVNANELLGATINAFKELQSKKSALMVMNEHPKILKQRIRFAKTEPGWRDRNAIDTAVGFLPSPRGASLTLNLAPQLALPKKSDDVSSPDIEDMFVPIDQELEEWQENRTALLKDKN